MSTIILENKSMQDESADQHPQHEKKAGHHINIRWCFKKYAEKNNMAFDKIEV
ncbi:hypothetical protein ABLU22_15960 [Acinetobacter lwoffii]|uniref:hypothetical protein n=1 Tax=Acinetobacter lwoffii TaxID=28090 RepID=UPI0032B5DABC